MRTSNPALRESVFKEAGRAGTAQGTMTINGTIHKTGFLLVLATISAGLTWNSIQGGSPGEAAPWVFAGAIGGFIAAMVTSFKREWAPITAPIYAALEGLFLGGISAMYAAAYHGIIFQAVGLTFATLFILLVAYRTGYIRATEKFKAGVIAATGAIFVFYLVTMVLSLFHVPMPLIHSSGVFGIGFSVVVVVIAALNLVLDFDLIETGASYGAPKYMEWYGGFALMVTLVWLYLEILRLLAKLQDRRG